MAAVSVTRGEVWRAAAGHAYQAAAVWGRSGDAATAGELAALSDVLTVLGAEAPPVVRERLREAADAFERAGRAPGPRRMDSPAAVDLRAAAMLLARSSRAGGWGGEDVALAWLLVAVLLLVVAAMRWHQQHGHTAHQEGAAQAGWHLGAAAEQATGAAATPTTRRAGPPSQGGPGTPVMLAEGERIVGEAVPHLRDRILHEAAWPGLAATLATMQGAGLDPVRVLQRAAARRGLGDAQSVSEVLVWRLTRALHATASADIPATSPIPGGVPRSRPVPARPDVTAPAGEGLRCGSGPDAPTLGEVVGVAVPEHVEVVLADPGAPALAQALGRAREAGWDAPGLLTEVAQARGLDDALSVAQVLTWRLEGWLHRLPAPVDPANHNDAAQEMPEVLAAPHVFSPDTSSDSTRGRNR